MPALIFRLSYWLDAALLALAFSTVWSFGSDPQVIDVLLTLILVPLWLTLQKFYGLYESNRLQGLGVIARKVIAGQATALLFASALLMLTGRTGSFPSLLRFAEVAMVAVLAEKLAAYMLLRRLRGLGYDMRRVCVVSTENRIRQIADRFREHPEWGSTVACVGVGTVDERRFYSYPNYAFISNSLEALMATQVIDEVLISLPAQELPREQLTLGVCEQLGVVGRVIVEPPSSTFEASRVEAYFGELTYAVGAQRQSVGVALKRIVDIVVSAGLLIGLAPLLLLTAVLVKLSSPGRVIFAQSRVGLHGRQFRVYKFRTMVDGAEALLPSLVKPPALKNPSDFRVTKIGRVLRRLSLDELPQLVNVLIGDMSLVGPRPLVVHESAAISGSHRRRFSMRPGLTCLREVNGRGNVDYATWMNYDLQYVDRWSLRLDGLVLLKTIPAVFTRRGAY